MLLIGAGVCADYIVQKNYESSISFPDNKLGVLVACASEKGLIKIENLNEQEFFYRIYVIDYTNDEKRQKMEMIVTVKIMNKGKFQKNYLKKISELTRPVVSVH